MKYQTFNRNEDESISLEFYHLTKEQINYYSEYPWRETNNVIYLLSLMTPEELNRFEKLSETEADDVLHKLYLQDKTEEHEEYNQNQKTSFWQKLFSH